MALSVREALPRRLRNSIPRFNNTIRYTIFLEPAKNFRDQLIDQLSEPIWPGPNMSDVDVRMVPWMVEAPLNSVEVLEAILRPSKPLVVRAARHFPRHCRTNFHPESTLRLFQRRYLDFMQYEGCLTEDREISFVCIAEDDAELLRQRLVGTGFTSALLHYISIPWSCRSGRTDLDLVHPWAALLSNEPGPEWGHTYERRLNTLLSNLGLDGCKFERSLLQPGTTPLPECVWDWVAGIPGRTAALPYYVSEECDDGGEEKEGLTDVPDENTKVEVKSEP